MKRTVLPLLLACGLIGVMGCDTQSPTQTVSPSASPSPTPSATPTLEPFVLTSSAFQTGGVIPDKYGGFTFMPDQYPAYQNKSIPLHWGEPPTETKAFALVMRDKNKDADGSPFIHWAVIDIPVAVRNVTEGASGTDQLKGTEVAIGSSDAPYRGPFPPFDETHQYSLAIYALDAEHLTLVTDPNSGHYTLESLEAELAAHQLAKSELLASFTMPAMN